MPQGSQRRPFPWPHAGGLAAVLALAPAPVVPAALALGFTDVSLQSGIVLDDVTYGAAWADFDDDGALDLFVCRHYLRPVIYRNLGDGTFSFVFFPPLFDAQDHHGPLVGDLDEDGDPDIYLTAGADAGTSEVPKRFYRNDGGFQFQDVASEVGLADSLARGRSTSAMDVDGDGDVDLFVAKAPRAIAPNSLFLSDGNGGWTDAAAAAGVADDFGSAGGIWGDYDGDGDPDLLIGGEEQTSNLTVLYRNDGGATFTDVTTQVLPGIGRISGADWGDYDGDGDPDLAVGRGDPGLFDAVTWSPDSITFYFNGRDGENGVDGIAFVQEGDSASFDLWFNGFYDPTRIHIGPTGRNPGPVTPFTEADDIVGSPPFVPGADTGFYLWVSSFDTVWQLRTSAPPLSGATFAGAIAGNGPFTDVSTTQIEAHVHDPRGTQLWRNDGGTFVDVTSLAGIADTANVRSVTWVDLDQDGALDLHVLNRGDAGDWNAADLVYRNLGDGTFLETAATWGLQGPDEGMADAAVHGDYDGDGDLDVLLTSGSAPRFFSIREHHRLYRNDGPVGHWLDVRTEGVQSSRPGYGARVICIASTTGRQTRMVTGNAWRGENRAPGARFGLGPDAVVDSLRIEWPSGVIDLVTDVAADQRIAVVEGSHPAVDAPAPRADAGPLRIAAGPNPSPARTELRFSGRQDRPATLRIVDAAGRRIVERPLAPGVTRWTWDGRDRSGRRVAAGVYFVRVAEGERTADLKLVRLGG